MDKLGWYEISTRGVEEGRMHIDIYELNEIG